MKFEVFVDIDVPKQFATDLFSVPENMEHWQPEFQSIERVEGPPGEPGTQTFMNYQAGKHQFVLIETIRTNNLPDEFIAEYETPGTCWNTMHSIFEETGPGKTRYVAKIHYKMFGMVVKVMSWVAPGVFKKQTQKYLDNFKAFAEQRFAESKNEGTNHG